MDNDNVPWAQRVNAARTLYEFGYGKAPASVKIEATEDSAAQQWINVLKKLKDNKAAANEPKQNQGEVNVH